MSESVNKRKWARAGLFREYENVEYDETWGNPQAWEAVLGYVENLDAFREQGRGLLLFGPAAQGKTFAAHYVAREILSRGYSLYCLELASFTAMLQRQQSLQLGWSTLRDEEVYQEWKNADRLIQDIRKFFDWIILDDVGKEYSSGSGWTEAQFDWILRYRYNRGRPTIMTSNIPVERWELKYNESMSSFVHESCVVVEFFDEAHARR